jgi:putative acyl-CoA dehydrogenase
MPTHQVTNQPPALVGYDASDDPALHAALGVFRLAGTSDPDGTAGAETANARLREIGRLAGGEHAQEQGRLANEYPPKLRTHDRYGNRIDEVEFHRS